MIDATARVSLGSVRLPGATLVAEAARAANGQTEIWIFVHPWDVRRAVTLLHLDALAWRRLHAFIVEIHDRVHARMPDDVTHRGAYR